METDYLVVGAGVSALAFTDALAAHSDAEVLMVDRRERVGGHWRDAYSFLRLHAPSAFYGVNSRTLGNDAIDTDGANAGFYERASAAEICAYLDAVLEENLLPSGRVRFLSAHEYERDGDGHAVVSAQTGERRRVRVRRKVVDTTYIETTVPATHTPRFRVDADARLVPVGAVAEPDDAVERYVILGSGKTAQDACVHLLQNGVEPDRIRWVRPRDTWLLDRSGFQPLEQVGSIVEGFSLDVEAVAQARDVEDLFARLEAAGRMLRIDGRVAPTMYRCAIVSQAELAQMRAVEDVVRLGRVRRLTGSEIVLEDGTVQTGPRELCVDCTASGISTESRARPAFEPGLVRIQQVQACTPTFNAAFIGFVEATRDDVAEQNRLCPVSAVPTVPEDWLRNLAATYASARIWRREPDVAEWVGRARLNPLRGTELKISEPRVQQSLERNSRNRDAAAEKLRKFLREPELVIT